MGDYSDPVKWDETVRSAFERGVTVQSETIWPRDSLFQYLLLMSTLQENTREFQELQMLAGTLLRHVRSAFLLLFLAAVALAELHDD